MIGRRTPPRPPVNPFTIENAYSTMRELHLNCALDKLVGPSRELLIVNNQWAAVALNRFHTNSNAPFSFVIDGKEEKILLSWDSEFSTAGMKEKNDMANHGGVSLAMFVMSVLMDYTYVEQSEIGDGVDYWFSKSEPKEEELNFLSDYHFVEVSGILEESNTNNLVIRVRAKHKQIDAGGKRNETSSVIVTLFSEPRTVKEKHN